MQVILKNRTQFYPTVSIHAKVRPFLDIPGGTKVEAEYIVGQYLCKIDFGKIPFFARVQTDDVIVDNRQQSAANMINEVNEFKSNLKNEKF